METTLVEVDVAALAFLVGTLIPVLTALVTKAQASSGTKAIVNALLSAVAGAASLAIASDGAFDLWSTALAIGVTWFASISTHFGLLKPAGVTGANGAVARATGNAGIG